MIGFNLLRAVMPPWTAKADPLVSYDLRLDRRAGQRPWAVVMIGYLLLGILCIYFLALLTQDDIATLEETVLGVCGFTLLGLALMMMVGHWRLLLAVSARSAQMIAGRRRNGDWDLIAITPVDKKRWFLSQIRIIGWQVFPLVRQLLVIQTTMVIIGFGVILYARHSLIADDPSTYGEDFYLSLPVYLLVVFPVAIGLIMEPFWAVGLFAAASLYASCYSRRVTMSLVYSFLGVFTLRVIMTLLLFIAFFALFGILGSLTDAAGLTDLDLDWGDLSDISLIVLPMICFYALGFSFFLEWIPVIVPILFLVPTETGNFVFFYLVGYLTLGLGYLVVPLVMMHILGRLIIQHINRREV